MIAEAEPRVSIVIPVHNEDEAIRSCLTRILAAITLPCEVLVVFDDPADTTVAVLEEYRRHDPRVVPTHNTYGPGPARAMWPGRWRRWCCPTCSTATANR